MGRLIDREAAIEAIRDLQLDPSTTQYIYSSDAIDAVKKQPAVDAVPIKPLCEWLAERYEPPYALIDIDKLRTPIDFRQQKEIWMAALTKWMEEQDAAE